VLWRNYVSGQTYMILADPHLGTCQR